MINFFSEINFYSNIILKFLIAGPPPRAFKLEFLLVRCSFAGKSNEFH